jgi:hypothetical protein
MHKDLCNLLNAFFDGELHGANLQEFTLHLASCESCRCELDELHLVSDLLQASPTPEFTSAERFASNLSLSMPRRSLRDLPTKSVSRAWWLIPLGLLAAWFFVQTVFTLSGLITAAETTHLLGQAGSGLGTGQQTIWLAIFNLFGGQSGGVHFALSLLNGFNILGADLLAGFLWQALIVLLYWVWLFVWWLNLRSQPMGMD